MNHSLFTLLLLPLLLVIENGHASDTSPVIPPAAYGDQCVAETDVMRRDHMKLLNHQRDDTVIDGIRGEPFSLVSCVNCHAQRDDKGQAIRIDAEGQFCQSCHVFAAVKIDCFTCHAALPEENSVIGGLPWQHPAVAEAGSYQVKQLKTLQLHGVAGSSRGESR